MSLPWESGGDRPLDPLSGELHTHTQGGPEPGCGVGGVGNLGAGWWPEPAPPQVRVPPQQPAEQRRPASRCLPWLRGRHHPQPLQQPAQLPATQPATLSGAAPPAGAPPSLLSWKTPLPPQNSSSQKYPSLPPAQVAHTRSLGSLASQLVCHSLTQEPSVALHGPLSWALGFILSSLPRTTSSPRYPEEP